MGKNKNILLLGDYSGVHHNLHKSLVKSGHNVEFISSGDGYKQIPTIKKWTDILSRDEKGRLDLNNNNEILSGFDVVQLINPLFADGLDAYNVLMLYRYLRENNKKIYLYSCGDDYYWVKNSLLSLRNRTIFRNPKLFLSKEIGHPIKYILIPSIVRLCKEIYKTVDGIIPGSIDYEWCIPESEKKMAIIPFPVDLSYKQVSPVRKNKIYNIIHAYQPGKRYRKGDDCFQVGAVINTEKFNIKKIGGLPYLEYMNAVNDCDILFDQAYSNDQGMSALHAMSLGKITFSGFSERFKNYYQLSDPVGVNVNGSIENVISALRGIEQGDIDVEEISKNSIEFIKKHHDSDSVSKKFIECWFR